MTQFEISIVSDTVCPWCYIGYRRLKAAIAQHLTQHRTDSFSISWHPFQLDPHSPRGQSIEKTTSYESKFGAQQAEMIFERLRSAAKGTGIEFSFAGRTGNTLDSHRLIEFAQRRDISTDERSGHSITLQTRLVEEIFVDYFERERDITSHSVLIAAARRVGLDEDEIAAFLRSDSLAKEVEEMAKENRERGVNGVPNFTINGVFTVEGAQEPAAFQMLFNRLKKREGAVL